MKKIIIIITVFLSMPVFAQHHEKGGKVKLSNLQKVQIEVKSLGIDLGLSQKQKDKLTVVLLEQEKNKEKMKAKKKALKAKMATATMSSDEKFDHIMTMLNHKEAFHKKVADVLNDQQYLAFTKLQRTKKKSKRKGAARKNILHTRGNRKVSMR